MLTESEVKLPSSQNVSQQNIAAALSWVTEAACTEAPRRKWGFLSCACDLRAGGEKFDKISF